MSGFIRCPRCEGPIRFSTTQEAPDATRVQVTHEGSEIAHVHIYLNQMDIHRHARCYLDPGDGEPIVELQVAS